MVNSGTVELRMEASPEEICVSAHEMSTNGKCHVKEADKGVDPPPAQVQLAAEETGNTSQARYWQIRTRKKTSMNGLTSRSASLIHRKEDPHINPRKMNLTQFFADNADVLPVRAATFWLRCLFYRDNPSNVHRLQPHGGRV